ncbi:MAG: hypothetical protein AAF961_03275 [Planctomycetota bacterium]
MTRTHLFTALALLGFLPLPDRASADLVIEIGDIQLFENTANQVVPISVTGGDPVQGLNFNIQVADGGPEAPNGVMDGPAITGVDVIGPGTIFNGNNTGQGGNGLVLPQFAEAITTTSSGTVNAVGTLAFVTFDTTGFSAGSSFDLLLKGTLNSDTDFAGVSANITNGTISLVVVPEPSAFLYAGAIAALAGGCVRLKQRRFGKS